MLVLERDTDAVLIPAGTPVRIPGGTEVTITQSLGGTFTVFVNGNLARIDGKDADALGLEVETQEQAQKTADGPVDENAVWAQLKTVFDPEIPVDIVELGLIYKMEVTEGEGTNRVDITMTLTAPACPVAGEMPGQVAQRVAMVEGVGQVAVTLTWDPPWDMSKMSEDARLALGIF